ncbi:MAG: methyltransferase domain-containing protein [Jatrophihabitans sp.]
MATDDAGSLAAQSLAQGDPTGWFDRLYRAAADGATLVPWDSDSANPILVDWSAGLPAAIGQRAMVVGCGLGRDAEHLAWLGYDTTAFDVAPTAIAGARARYPDSIVDYRVADLFALPDEWIARFDLVVESYTVQALPVALHTRASAAVTSLVAPAGTLLVISAVGASGVDVAGPPWPLTAAEIDRFAADGLEVRAREQVPGRSIAHWRVEFVRA